jgi:hypothetical protein
MTPSQTQQQGRVSVILPGKAISFICKIPSSSKKTAVSLETAAYNE